VNRAERLRYYWGRLLDRLQQHGVPFRSRSLLFFHRAGPMERGAATSYADGGVIGPVPEQQFRNFRWAANANVVRETLVDRRTGGRRWGPSRRDATSRWTRFAGWKRTRRTCSSSTWSIRFPSGRLMLDYCGIDVRYRRGFALLYALFHFGPQLRFAHADGPRPRLEQVVRWVVAP
jgi:hypothetical protein